MPPSMLDIHTSALSSANSVYHEFLLCYKRGQVVYGFVEGKDDPGFYRGAIDSLLPSNWSVRLFMAGNKDSVTSLHDTMDWSRFPKERICFFMDRDLSLFLGEQLPMASNVYITDGYSIENSICDYQAFERVLAEVLNLSGLREAELQRAQELFNCNCEIFHRSMLDVMAQLALWMKNGFGPCFNNFDACGLFLAAGGVVRLRVEFESASARLQHLSTMLELPISTEDELDDAAMRLAQLYGGNRRCIRGKYLLSFFVFCAREMHSAIAAWCPRIERPPSPKMTIGAKSAMMAFAPRARCPESLKLFLQRNFVAYVSTQGTPSA